MATSAMADPGRQARSFLASLFDLSFSYFITLKLVRWLFMLGLAAGAVLVLVAIFAAFNVRSGLGVLVLLLSPVLFLLIAVYVRVALEIIAIFFRLEENTARVANKA